MFWSDAYITPPDSKSPFYFGPLAGYEKEHLEGRKDGDGPENKDKTPEEIKQVWKKGLGRTIIELPHFTVFKNWSIFKDLVKYRG